MSINEKKSWLLRPKLLGILVIVLVIIALTEVIFQVGFKNKLLQVQVNENTNNSNTPAKFPLPPEQDEIFSRTGIITEINNNVLSIAATIRKGDTFSEATLKIITNDSTRFSALKTSPIPDKVTDEERLTEISFKDIVIGNTITATAETNIKELSEFVAIEIRRIDRI